MGGPLGQGALVADAHSDDESVEPVYKTVGGYMIVSASGFEHAAEICRRCPGLVQPGSGVEIIEIRVP